LNYLRSPGAREVQGEEYIKKKIGEMGELREKSQREVERLVGYWEDWVERKELGTVMFNLIGEGIEEAYQVVRREHITDRAGSSDSESSAKTSNTTHLIPLRSSQGLLTEKTDGFTLTSGILTWSRLLPIYYSSTLPTINLTGNAATIPPILLGGTIRQHVQTYTSAARNGRWKVRRAYSNWTRYPGSDGQPIRQWGWVFSHGEVDPLEVVKRCRVISQWFGGISNGNGHVDKVVDLWGSTTRPDTDLIGR
jgi:hypothetical protein